MDVKKLFQPPDKRMAAFRLLQNDTCWYKRPMKRNRVSQMGFSRWKQPFAKLPLGVRTLL